MIGPLFFLLVMFSAVEVEAEVLWCDRIVNEQVHSLKVRGLLDQLL